MLPPSGLQPSQLAVIINDLDPLSKKLGKLYQQKRGIPQRNMIHVELPIKKGISEQKFHQVYADVLRNTPDHVQAYVLIWNRPYKVGCMSITSAFATGYDDTYCAKIKTDQKCGPTKPSPYFDSQSTKPYDDHHIRPTMLLPFMTANDGIDLIERGIEADGSFPDGTVYLLKTSDKNRTVREHFFPVTQREFSPYIKIQVLDQDYLKNAEDVFVYVTGMMQVDHIENNEYLPGAIADHLTSGGGHIPGGRQMSAIRWLQAGATGSYGAVREPCNYLQKFPHPAILLRHYLQGNTLIEAYWKSVAWPAEGLFIGEPLANPFAGAVIHFEGNNATIEKHSLHAGLYSLESAPSPLGPFKNTGQIVWVQHFGDAIKLESLDEPFYRLVKH